MKCDFMKMMLLICLNLSYYSVEAQQRMCDLEAICISPADTVVNGKGLILRFGRKNLGPDVMFSNDTTFYRLYRIVDGQQTIDYSGAFSRIGSNDTVGIGDSTIYRDNYAIGFNYPNRKDTFVLDYCVLLYSWGIDASRGDTLRFGYHDSNAANNTCCKQVVVLPAPKATAIADLDGSSESFTIYPNPVRHTLYLHTEEVLNTDELQLSILNMMGRKMLVKDASELHGHKRVMSVDVSSLPAGLYQVHLLTPEGIKTKKIVVYK